MDLIVDLWKCDITSAKHSFALEKYFASDSTHGLTWCGFHSPNCPLTPLFRMINGFASIGGSFRENWFEFSNQEFLAWAKCRLLPTKTTLKLNFRHLRPANWSKNSIIPKLIFRSLHLQNYPHIFSIFHRICPIKTEIPHQNLTSKHKYQFKRNKTYFWIQNL